MTESHTAAFGERLAAAVAVNGPLCVGIDPHEYLLEEWGLPVNALGLHDFGMRVIEACAGEVAIVKPQVAFYERHGSAGFRALEDLIGAARAAGVLVLADAKRGDLGSTLQAYAEAWLLPGSPLEADAVTVAPYLGFGSLEPAFELAKSAGKGVFVLAATSNPEARELQTSILQHGTASGSSVAGSMVSLVSERNATDYAGLSTGSLGVVLGATVDFADLGVDLASVATPPTTPVLAPGFGHQGARVADLRSVFGPAAPSTLVAASRSILAAGPHGIVDAVRRQKHEVMEAIA